MKIKHVKKSINQSINQLVKRSHRMTLYCTKVSFLIWILHILFFYATGKFSSFWRLAHGYLSTGLFKLNGFWIVQVPWSSSLQYSFAYFTCWKVYFIFLHTEKNENAWICSFFSLTSSINYTYNFTQTLQHKLTPVRKLLIPKKRVTADLYHRMWVAQLAQFAGDAFFQSPFGANEMFCLFKGTLMLIWKSPYMFLFV